jgi:hypothetical protein
MTDTAQPAAATEPIPESTGSTAAPEERLAPPGRWIRENLFSSIGNTIQTIVFSLIIVGLLRWVLGQVFSEETEWDSVATNIKLLFTYNFPLNQFARVWVAAGLIFFAIGASMAAWNLNPAITVRKLGVTVGGFGVFFVLCGAIAPSAAPSNIRTGMFIVGAILAILGLGPSGCCQNPIGVGSLSPASSQVLR